MALPKVVDALVHDRPKVFARVAQQEVLTDPNKTLDTLRTTANVLANGTKPHLGQQQEAQAALRTLHKTAGPLEDVVLFHYGDDPEVAWNMARYLHRADRALDSLGFFETALDHAPESSVVMARFADALMDAHKDMPTMEYDTRALELAMRAHRIENSEYTQALMDRITDATDERLRMAIGPAYETAESLTPATMQ